MSTEKTQIFPDFMLVMAWRAATADMIVEKAQESFLKNHPEISGGLVGYSGMSLIEAKQELNFAPTSVLEEFAKAYGGKTLEQSLEEMSEMDFPYE